MDQISLIKLKLLKEAEIFKFGTKAKDLIHYFVDHRDCLDKPQEAFISASLNSNLIGNDSLVLSTRIKCSNAISFVFKNMGIKCNVDAIDPKLMISTIKKEI